jgi:hypothetical protein
LSSRVIACPITACLVRVAAAGQALACYFGYLTGIMKTLETLIDRGSNKRPLVFGHKLVCR